MKTAKKVGGLKIVRRGEMPDGSGVQIEDWASVYTSHSYADTVAAYPTATRDSTELYPWPQRGKSFRLSLQFKNEQEAAQCFEALVSGEKKLADFADNFDRKSDIEYIS